MDKTSCAFTGHHPMRFDFGFDEEDQLCVTIKKVILSKMMALYKNGVITFYSDCEVGVDLWAAELALGMMKKYPDVQLVCVIPYEEQAKKWTSELRNRYYTVLEKSSYNQLISAPRTDNCYQLCAKYLVNHAGYLIAVYDNSNVTRLDNAAYAVAYAKRKGRIIIYIDPDTAQVTSNSINA
jgi:uncharacterized phage-like protein YoqJ